MWSRTACSASFGARLRMSSNLVACCLQAGALGLHPAIRVEVDFTAQENPPDPIPAVRSMRRDVVKWKQHDNPFRERSLKVFVRVAS